MGLDVTRNIRIFQEHGGWCDCMILFNVEQSFKGAKKMDIDPLAPNYSDLFGARIDVAIEARLRLSARQYEEFGGALNDIDVVLARYDKLIANNNEHPG